VPAALSLWVLNFSDRFFLVALSGPREVGLYSIGVRLSSAILFLLIAFSTAWPAFAYSIEDELEARRTYGMVLTYLLFVCCWLSLGIGLLAPWLVRLLTTPPFYSSARVVAPLAFALAAYAGYTVVVIGLGRAGKTGFNWIVTGAAALLDTGLNIALIPRYGMTGAAIATLAAYTTMFVAMAWYVQRIYPVPYRWKRVAVLAGGAAGLTVLGKSLEPSLAGALGLTLAYPLVIALAAFCVPTERLRLRRLAASLAPLR
jgi:O-antigen/teichoic acid export membrane protein